jgi:alkylation response protein AidB-like acyl-CoA dehydrogenase
MEMTASERQQHFIKLATTHAEDFKTRVTKHDRDNSFPFENIEALKASGYLNMTLPAELGGGGASLPDLVLAQERLARGDGPTAVAVNMHIFNVAVRADLWRLGDEKQRPFLQTSARDSLILCSGTSDPRMNTVIGFAGLNDTTRHAEKVDGGYRVNGRAGFGTLCVCADFFEETAHYDDPANGPQCLFFTVPAKLRVSRYRTTGKR